MALRNQLEAGLARHSAKPHEVIMGPCRVVYKDKRITVRHYTDTGILVQTNNPKPRKGISVVVINRPKYQSCS